MSKVTPEQLVEILKFTPRTYTIRIWGYGGEIVMGRVDRKIYDYFRDNRLNVSDYAFDWDYVEEKSIPEEMRPFEPGSWYDCDNLAHENGADINSSTVEIDDENGNTLYTISDLLNSDIESECRDEMYISDAGAGSIVYYGNSSEKGTFFEGEIELTAPFDLSKLRLEYTDVEGAELISTVIYDGEEIDNFGGSTNGKGTDIAFYRITDKLELERYENGSDADPEFDDGTPPMGPSPYDWEMSVKIKKGNPTISGWYSCNYAGGSTYSSLYWNNEKTVWEDYTNGRVTRTYSTVDYYQGYNWDTSDWANRPPAPPELLCECGWTGMHEDQVDDDERGYLCPACHESNTNWIDYDANTAKGRKNRKLYCK